MYPCLRILRHSCRHVGLIEYGNAALAGHVGTVDLFLFGSSCLLFDLGIAEMVIGPATRGEMERPLGIKDMGTWKAAVYTQEQQRRLGVGEFGQKLTAPIMGTARASAMAPHNVQPVEDMGSWKISHFGYTSEQEARLGSDHHTCSHCNGLPVVPPTMTSSFGKAVLNSPALLKGLCNMYFRRYDVNRNNVLELSEVQKLCDDLHVGLGMSMSSITPEALKASVGKFSETDKLGADEFQLWFAETLKESIQVYEKTEMEQAAAGLFEFKVRSAGRLASIKAPLDVSMRDIIEAVAAVLELPSANTYLLHGDKQLPSETLLSELGLSEQTELTAIVVK